MEEERSFRHSKSFGERCEYAAIAELLKRGLDVYKTLVDDRGIDCIVRINNKRYIDIQIKARSKNVREGDEAFFAGLEILPRENFFYIFYSEYLDTFWVIPSRDVVKKAWKAKSGENVGTYNIYLIGHKKGKAYPLDRYKKYENENGFALLK